MSIRSKSQMILKNRTFRIASCLARYLVCASAGQADKMWAMLSGAVPHSLLAESLLSLTRIDGWCTTVWVIGVCRAQTCLQWSVLGRFTSHSATKSAAQHLAFHLFLFPLLAFLAISVL